MDNLGGRRMATNLDHKGPDVQARSCDAPCEACGATLTHLGDMPRTVTRDAVRVFRCYSCNAVVSKQWSASDERADRHCSA
jgi:hypothetical protein